MAGSRLNRIALGAIFALVLCWPAILNGGPILYFDSIGYLRNALSGLEAVLHVDLSIEPLPTTASDHAPTTEAPATEASAGPKIVLGGRSVFYGVPLALSWMIADLRLVVVAQAALAAAAILLFLRLTVRRPLPAVLVSGGVLAVLSPLPFFVSYIMPDVLTGIVILALTALLSSERWMTRVERWFWFGTLVFGLLAHLSHLLIAAILLAGAVSFRAIAHGRREQASGRFGGRGAALVATALMIAMAGEAAFGLVVEHFYKAEVVRPPFLTARIVEDGPGYAYLRESCPESGFEMCNHLAGPQEALGILWSEDGAFKTADNAARIALSREQFRIFWQTLLHEPLWSLETFGQNLAEQTLRFRLDEFAYPEGLRQQIVSRLPADESARAQRTLLYRGEGFPLALFGDLGEIGAALSLAAIALALFVPSNGASPAPLSKPSFASLASLLLLGLLANAGVTGILSGPFDRYQARVIWLLPLLATILVWRRWVERRPPRADSDSGAEARSGECRMRETIRRSGPSLAP